MVLNRQAVRECAALGSNLGDKVALGLFGLVAPTINNAGRRRWRLASRLIPNVWLRPRRLNGLRLLIDPTDWSQTVIFDEVFLKGSYDLAKVPFRPDVIIDCGAHIGLFSLLARSTFPGATLIAYEPNPANAVFVRAQIEKNKAGFRFHEAAVSTESGEMDFIVFNSHGGRLSEAGKTTTGDIPMYRVRVVDFCTALQDIRPASLLLKMDVEGEERNLLPAIVPLLPRQTALFFETHAGAEGWKEAEALLAAAGFSVQQINARGLFCDGFASRGSNGDGQCH